MKTNKTFKLRALEQFKCIAGDCPRNCCSESWDFPVDNATLEKWNALTDADEKAWFLNALANTGEQGSDKLKVSSDKRCCFLNREDLCEVQMKYGQSYLPSICRNFPRATIQTRQVTYETAWYSCPEITRLVLEGDENSDPFILIQSETVPDLLQEVVLNDTNLFVALDEWQASVLGLDKFPLGVRLFFIASVYAQLVQRTQSGNLSQRDIDILQQNTRNNLYEMNLAYKQQRLAPDPVTAGSYWKVIVDLCAGCHINTDYLMGGEGDLQDAMNNCDGSHAAYARIYDVIKQYRQQSQSEIRQRYGQALKLFMRNYFAATGFPLQPVTSDHGITLVKCLSGLCMLQLLLWLAAQRKADLSMQLFQDLVVEVHRRYIHNNTTELRLKEDRHMQNFAAYSICAVDLF